MIGNEVFSLYLPWYNQFVEVISLSPNDVTKVTQDSLVANSRESFLIFSFSIVDLLVIFAVYTDTRVIATILIGQV